MRADITSPEELIEETVRANIPLYSQQEIVITYLREQRADIKALKADVAELKAAMGEG